MKINNKVYYWHSSFLLYCLVGIYTYCLYYRPFTFNFEPTYYDHYYILSISVAIFCISSIYAFVMMRDAFLTASNLLPSVLALGGITLLIYTKDFANEHYVICLSLFLLLIGFSKHIRLNQLQLPLAFVFLMYIIEIILAATQIFNDRSGNIAIFTTGSLHNSGILSCYLVIHIPFLKHFLFDSKRLALQILFGFLVLITTIILGYTQSRTAIVSLTIILSIIILQENDRLQFKMNLYKYVKRYIYSAIAILCITLIGLLFFFKIQSSFGRLLILNIAAKHFDDFFWTGVGFGKFTHYYPIWQIEYFKNSPVTWSSYFMNAGESYVAFNEFAQLFIEIGVFRFLVIVVFLYDFFNSRSELYGKLLNVMKISMTAILICCVTSYSLHCIPILILTMALVTFSYLIRDNVPLIRLVANLKTVNSFKIILLALSSIVLYNTAIKCIAVHRWTLIFNSTDSEQSKIKSFGQIYPVLQNDDKFLINYGELLSTNDVNCLTADTILKRALNIQITYRGLESLSNSYKCSNDYQNLFNTYQKMAWFIPSRLRPKYGMVMTLCKLKKYDTAKIIANQILHMPVKIPSDEASQIIGDMSAFLKENQPRPVIDKKTDKK